MNLNKIFKKNFWKFLIIDFAFVFLIFSFTIFSRVKIKQYLALIESYSTEISSLQVGLQQESTEALAQLQAVLAQFGPLVDKVAFFAFFIVPSTIFILWIINQTINFSLINKGKWFSLKHLLYFALYTLPFFILFIVLGNALLTLFYSHLFAVMLSWQFYLYFILLILTFYLAQVFYSFMFKKHSLFNIRKFLGIAVKDFATLFVYYLPYIGTWFVIFIILISAFLKYGAGDFTGLILTAIPILFLLLVLSWFRLLFTKKVQDKF